MLRRGSLASTYDITAFIRTDPALDRPDAQLTFWSLTPDRTARAMRLEKDPGMLLMGYPLRTRSEGSVRARSIDPTVPLLITTNFLADEYDRRVMVGMFRYMRRFVEQVPLSDFIDHEIVPGQSVQLDEQIMEACRQDDTCMHAVGTRRGPLCILRDRDAGRADAGDSRGTHSGHSLDFRVRCSGR